MLNVSGSTEQKGIPTASPELQRIAADLTEVEERILSLWSAPGSTWLSIQRLVDEFGFSPLRAVELLTALMERGMVEMMFRSSPESRYAYARWNISPAGVELVKHLRNCYAQTPVLAVCR